MTEGEELARACAAAAADKKAEDVVVLDMQGISTFTDFFVICSGTSEPQLKAIASAIREQAREKLDRHPMSEDGFPGSQWIVLDYPGVIVHIFLGEKREYYGLENLWSDAPRLKIEEQVSPGTSASGADRTRSPLRNTDRGGVYSNSGR